MAIAEPNVQINFGAGPGPTDVDFEDITHEEHILPFQRQFVAPINPYPQEREPFVNDNPHTYSATPIHPTGTEDVPQVPFVDDTPVPGTNPVGTASPVDETPQEPLVDDHPVPGTNPLDPLDPLVVPVDPHEVAQG